MGRPKGGKNAMRTPEEKEAIVLEYLNGQSRSIRKTAEKYGITDELLRGWMARGWTTPSRLRSTNSSTKHNPHERHNRIIGRSLSLFTQKKSIIIDLKQLL